MKKKILSLVFVFALLISMPLSVNATTEYDSPKLIAKATSSSGATIKVSWVHYKDSVRYVVYGAKRGCSYKKLKSISCDGTTSNTSTTVKKINGKKLKKHQIYKFYVVAFDDDEEISRSNTMTVISGKTFGKKKQYSNPTSINILHKQVNLERDNKVSAVSIADISSNIYSDKKHLSSSYGTKYRYIVDKPNIINVSSTGLIHVYSNAAIGSTATIFVQELNGVYNSFKVNVVEAGAPASTTTIIDDTTTVYVPTHPYYPYPYLGNQDGYYWGDIRYSSINDTTISYLSNINTKYNTAIANITGTDPTSQAQKTALANERDSRCSMVRSLEEYILYRPTAFAFDAYVHEIDKIYTTAIGVTLNYNDLLLEMKNNM